jgi:hypothetical protein
MTLLIISIPFMVLATAVAVIPLIVLSHREHQRQAAERAARMTSASTTTPPAQPMDRTVADQYSVAA